MQEKVAPTPSEDGSVDDPVSSIEAVHQEFTAGKRKPTFLKNVSLKVVSKGRTPSGSLTEAQLQTEKAINEELRGTLEELQRDKQAAKEATLKSEWDMQEMRTRQVEMEKKQDESNLMLKQLVAQLAVRQQH